MKTYKDIYDLVTTEKSAYTKGVELEEGWIWSMKDHLRRSYLYKHSQFEEHNDNRKLRPNKNIVRPILNVQYRTEGFDVKDIELYVDNPDIYYKSFLVDKFHNDWALENGLDTFIDEMVESYVDYGGALVRNSNEKVPEVVQLRTIAFGNQRDLFSAPFGILHTYTPTNLRKMAKWGWGDMDKGATLTVEELIDLTKNEEKELEVYEVHGEMPKNWLDENPQNDSEDSEDLLQIQIVAFYTDTNKNTVGVTLFKRKQPKLPFKLIKRDDIPDRALGFGGVEELFEPQAWTNFSEIQITEMLQSASKTLYKTTDPSFKKKNNLRDVDNGDVLTVREGADIGQLDTSPRNVAVFNDALERWQIQAQTMGAASEGLLGEAPSSGTPFKLYEAQNIEAKGLHKYRQGKIAVFTDEIYREWILPHISREIVNEKTFLTELSFDEIQTLANQIVDNAMSNLQKKKILSGQPIFPEDLQAERQTLMENFAKGGNKRFIKILKDEMKDVPIQVKTNIANKQKNLALLTDKVVNVLRQFIATPEMRQDPEMVKLLNTILESSGMSPIEFGATLQQAQPQQQQGGGGTEPLKAIGETAKTNV